jgi:hypothetical protein
MGSSGPGSTLPPGAGDSGTERAVPSHEPATQPLPVYPVQPSYQPVADVPPRKPVADAAPREVVTDAAAREPVTEVAPPHGATFVVAQPSATDGSRPAVPSEVMRYGPGVPVSQARVPLSEAGVAVSEAGVAAESVWRTGHRPGPPPRQTRLRRLRRGLGVALTVALLIAAGVVVWLRFFDHPPFHVTGVSIIERAKAGCGVNVTGRIETNGAAGTISYQWVFRPQTQAPQPLNQSVVTGQHAVYVTVAVQGRGHGSATQTVILDVLGPDPGTASADVTISC